MQFSVLFRGAIQIMSMECPVFLRRDAFKPFEHLGKVREIAREALRLAANKLSVKSKFVKKESELGGDNDENK